MPFIELLLQFARGTGALEPSESHTAFHQAVALAQAIGPAAPSLAEDMKAQAP